jgi:cellobiose phosphorylase
MHEVMSGSFFTPQRESVPEQTWSSSAFLSAAIHGMLGLESDGRKNVLYFEPQVPASWQSLRVEHVRVGNSIVDLTWHTEDRHFTLDVQNAGRIFHLTWTQARTGRDAISPVSLERDIMPGNTHLNIP